TTNSPFSRAGGSLGGGSSGSGCLAAPGRTASLGLDTSTPGSFGGGSSAGGSTGFLGGGTGSGGGSGGRSFFGGGSGCWNFLGGIRSRSTGSRSGSRYRGSAYVVGPYTRTEMMLVWTP